MTANFRPLLAGWTRAACRWWRLRYRRPQTGNALVSTFPAGRGFLRPDGAASRCLNSTSVLFASGPPAQNVHLSSCRANRTRRLAEHGAPRTGEHKRYPQPMHRSLSCSYALFGLVKQSTGHTAMRGASLQCMPSESNTRPANRRWLVTSRRRLAQGTSCSLLQAVTQPLHSIALGVTDEFHSCHVVLCCSRLCRYNRTGRFRFLHHRRTRIVAARWSPY